jgi:hypothetical protein
MLVGCALRAGVHYEAVHVNGSMRQGLSHSLIGLLTTLVNVTTAQNGNLSLTAKVTVAVTAAVGGSMLGLSVLYGQLLDNLITDRDREVAQHGHP